MPKMVLEMIKTSNLKSGWQILVEEFIFCCIPLQTLVSSFAGLLVSKFQRTLVSTFTTETPVMLDEVASTY